MSQVALRKMQEAARELQKEIERTERLRNVFAVISRGFARFNSLLRVLGASQDLLDALSSAYAESSVWDAEVLRLKNELNDVERSASHLVYELLMVECQGDRGGERACGGGELN